MPPVAGWDEEDILQPVEVALGDWVNTNQSGLEEGGPLGSREGAGSSFIFLGERGGKKESEEKAKSSSLSSILDG